MPKRVGDTPFVQRVEIFEAVVVQITVAPGMNDAPIVLKRFVVFVIERKPVAIRVAHHVV